MLVPLFDDDSRLRGPGYATYAFVGLNVLIFLLQPDFWVYSLGMIPYEIINGIDLKYASDAAEGLGSSHSLQGAGPYPIQLTLVSSMFLHGGWMHLLSNMLYLWIFGDNVENRLGTKRFILFYLFCGIAAGLAQAFSEPGSYVPMVGASGAISGVLGAYIVLFPRNKIQALIFYFPVSISAIVVIGLWIGLQLYSGWSELGGGGLGGVAYAAHFGGLVAGLLLGFIFRKTIPSRLKPEIE